MAGNDCHGHGSIGLLQARFFCFNLFALVPGINRNEYSRMSSLKVTQNEGNIAFNSHVNGSNGIVQKNDFDIRSDLGCTTLETSRKVVLDNPSVCQSVCLSDRLSCCRFSRELSRA